MKNKEEFLRKLSEILDKIENKDCEADYFSMTLTNYNPDNRKNDRKLSYFQVSVNYDEKSKLFELNDQSLDFECSMKYVDCTERGYCNGDC